jgi:hypothetical protein
MANKLYIDGIEYDRELFNDEAKALDERIGRINFQIDEKKRDIEDLYVINDVLLKRLLSIIKEEDSSSYATSYLSMPDSTS